MRRNFTPDETLVDKLLLNDIAAFEELSRRYCYSLYSYCMSKLNSAEDSKRVVRNIFISLWENRDMLPINFSISLHLYTEVRKAVVQCINVKLNKEIDIAAIEKQIIPGFSIAELQKAKQPIHKIQESNYHPSIVNKRRYEEPGWNKYSAINLKGLRHTLQNMLNFW
ncbi:MAG TPA: hypothetical protein VKC90_07780 [Chitinophagaceae bacterium]|nr:hypothetical protein [Chitinophagaceae bacterium]